MGKRTASHKTSAAKRERKRQAEEAENQSVVVPAEVFQQIMNVLGNLPYVQVAGLLQTINQTAKQGVYDEISPASGDEETD